MLFTAYVVCVLVKKQTTPKEPFAARLDMEIINAPSPVNPSRNDKTVYLEGKSPFSLPSTSLPPPFPILPILAPIFPHPPPHKQPLPLTHDAKPGNPTKYIHFILNQRTIPLHLSFPECETRDDGWCSLDTFLAVQSKSYELSQYEWSCNGDYPAVPYGDVVDGVPVHTRA
jgi:hypothetical protein